MANGDLNWPKRGDRVFRPSVPSAKQAQLEAFVMEWDGIHLIGFKRAADVLVEAAKTDDRNPDDLFFPVAYLYRHHLELKLKELVRLGRDSGSLDGCDNILGEHNLHKLWNKAKQLIQQVWPDSPDDDLNAVEHMILEFHQCDRTSQAFRYPRDKKGAAHSHAGLQRVDLVSLKTAVDAVSTYLEASCDGIDACDPGCWP